MKFASKTLFVAAFVFAAATSPVMAETSKKLTCSPAETLDKVNNMLNLAALDMMSVRSNLKKADKRPEDIGLTENDLKAVDETIAIHRAFVGYCEALSAISQVAGQYK